jgi:hypothetical protein
VAYCNSGCWTERPCHYLSVRNGQVLVRRYEGAEANDSGAGEPTGPGDHPAAAQAR